MKMEFKCTSIILLVPKTLNLIYPREIIIPILYPLLESSTTRIDIMVMKDKAEVQKIGEMVRQI